MLEAVQFMFEFWGKQVLKVVYFQWRGGVRAAQNLHLEASFTQVRGAERCWECGL